MKQYTKLNIKHWSKIPSKLQEKDPSLMGQKSRVGISVHAHECRNIFSRVLDTD